MGVSINELDYRYILIDRYKSLGLSEIDVMILLSIDNILKSKPMLVTADTLALKMTIDEKEIDRLIVSLMDRKFIEYEHKDQLLVTSLAPTYRKLETLYADSITGRRKLEQTLSEDDKQNIFEAFEKVMGTSLTRLDIDKIMEWIEDGIEDSMILESLNECATKNKKVTVRLVDKILLKRLTHKDREKEGYSTISERNKKEIEEAIEIASYRWTDSDE